MSIRLHFWLSVMDALAWLGLFGSRAFLFAVSKASDATDWGPAPEPDDSAEVPF